MTVPAAAQALFTSLRQDLPPQQYAAVLERLARRKVTFHTSRDPWQAGAKTPTPKQATFTEALLGNEQETIIHFGSARAGKSASACLALLAYGYRWPGSRILVGRYEHKRLWDSTMVSMGEALGWLHGRPWTHISQVTPDVGKWQAGIQHLRLTDGPEIAFTHFHEAGPLGSTEYDLAWIEEAQELPNEDRHIGGEDDEVVRTPEVVTMVQSRLNRKTHSAQYGDSFAKLLITAMGWGHNWVWDMAFLRPTARTLVLESTARDNQANIPPEWFQRMEALPANESRRYLECCHDEFAGRVFTGFTGANVCEPFPIPKTWPFVRGFDPGVRQTGWVWLTVATQLARLRAKNWPGIPEWLTDGTTIAFDEYSPIEMPIEDQAKEVLARDKRDGLAALFTGIDPSDARQQTGRGLRRAGELISDLGISPVFKAPNNETAFILKLQQACVARKFAVTNNCKRLIEQLTSEVYDEKANPGEPKRKYAREFHVLAALKYGYLMEPEIYTMLGVESEKPRQPSKSKTGY